MSRLRVAIIAPPWLALPVRGYGGIELVIQSLIEGMKKHDIDVELFANGARKMRGVKTHSFYKSEIFNKIDYPYYDAPLQIMQTHLQFALNRIEKGGFDIIHDHNPYIGPSFFSLAGRIEGIPPILHTFHGPPFSSAELLRPDQEDNRPQLQQIKNLGRLYMVCISDAMAAQAPKEIKSHLLPSVHNAIDIAKFPFVDKKKDYYVTLARFTADKGQHIAAKWASKLKKRLRMAGTVAGIGSSSKLLRELSNPLSPYRRNEEFRYYSDKVWSYVIGSRKVTYSGNLGGNKKLKFLSEARALLFPIQWEEPFGMAVIEALACGTPVVAMNRGAMSEIIEHGVTGFLANNEEEFGEFMQRVGEIDPAVCRRAAENMFSAERMADAYAERYQEVIARSVVTN